MTREAMLEGLQQIYRFYENMRKTSHQTDRSLPHMPPLAPFWRDRAEVIKAAIDYITDQPAPSISPSSRAS